MINKLDHVLSCIDNSSGFIQKAAVYINRFYYLLCDGAWHNNKSARRIVKYYLYEAAIGEKQPVDGKIREIFKKLAIKDLNIDLISRELGGEGFKRVGKSAPTTRMLFHIHADEFGKGSRLEGMDSASALAYLEAFLKKKGLYGAGEDLLREIHEGRFSGKGEVAEAFKTMKPMLMIGGWAGKPAGHAMYYEVIPTSDSLATVRFYNLGAGSGEHNEGLDGDKVKAACYVELTGVKKGTLLDENTHKILSELRTEDEKGSRKYSEEDIYQGLINLLEPQSVEGGPATTEELKTRQRSGVCAWRSLMAFMFAKLGKEQYKRFICDIKMQSLADSVSAMGTPSKVEWRLLHKSHRKLCRRIEKAFSEKVIGEKYYIRVNDKLKKIGAEIAQKRDAALQPRKTWEEFGLEVLHSVSDFYDKISLSFSSQNEKVLHKKGKGVDAGGSAL